MAGKFILDCGYCGRRYDASYLGMRCADCDGPLIVNTDLEPLKAKGPSREALRDPSLPGIFKYFPLLPISTPRAAISLNEGNTPLTHAGLLAERLGIEILYLCPEGGPTHRDGSPEPRGHQCPRAARLRRGGTGTCTHPVEGMMAGAIKSGGLETSHGPNRPISDSRGRLSPNA